MNIGRRGFLKAGLLTALAIAQGVPGMSQLERKLQPQQALEAKQQIPKTGFDCLWQLMLRYNSGRNNLYMHNRAALSRENIPEGLVDSLEARADVYWNDVVDYAKKDFPDVVHGEEISYRQLKKLCISKGKVCSKISNFNHHDMRTVFLGDIVQPVRENEHRAYKNKSVDYSVIVFESEPTIADAMHEQERLAWWEPQSDTVMVNMTAIKKDAEYVYSRAQNPIRQGSFSSFMTHELYDSIVSALKEDGVDFDRLDERAKFSLFEDKFCEVITYLTVVHESTHHFYQPSGSDEGLIRQEMEPLMAEITEPGYEMYNSWVFLKTHNSGRYEDFYRKIQESAGLSGIKETKSWLMSMAPGKRAEMCRKMTY